MLLNRNTLASSLHRPLHWLQNLPQFQQQSISLVFITLTSKYNNTEDYMNGKLTNSKKIVFSK